MQQPLVVGRGVGPWCLVVLCFGGAAASGQDWGLLWAAEVGWGRQRRTAGFVAAAVRSAQARSAGERSHLGERRGAVQRGVRQLEHARFPYLVRVRVRVRVRVSLTLTRTLTLTLTLTLNLTLTLTGGAISWACRGAMR